MNREDELYESPKSKSQKIVELLLEYGRRTEEGGKRGYSHENHSP